MENTSKRAELMKDGDAPEAAWAQLVPPEQWSVFLLGTSSLNRAGVRVLLAGAFALAHYTGHFRNTKDVDVVIHPEDRERAVTALLAAGFCDYFDREAYDRSWIFRSFRDGVIFDLIWALPNHRVQIDEAWFQRATTIRLEKRDYQTAPVEEMVRVKLYVFQRGRCDWVDVINLLSATVGSLDWAWLVERLGRDLPLLHGVLAVFNWMCAGRAREIPSWLRTQFALPNIEADDVAAMEERRARLFDSRPWFAAHQPTDRPMQL